MNEFSEARGPEVTREPPHADPVAGELVTETFDYDGGRQVTVYAGVQSYPRPVRLTGVPIHGSGMSTTARKRAVRKCEGWYGLYMDLDATKSILEELRELVDQLDRPPALGPLQVTIMAPLEAIDTEMARRYEELGLDRLVLTPRDEDVSGVPSGARRTSVLESIERAAVVLSPWLDPAS